MKSSIFLGLGLTVLLFSLCEGFGINFTMIPDAIKDQIDNKLVAICSVPASNEPNTRLSRIEIKKVSTRDPNDATVIGWMMGFDGKARGINESNVAVTGHTTLMSAPAPGPAVLTVTWTHPQFLQAGKYICEVQYYDLVSGAITKDHANKTVRDSHPHLEDALEKMARLEDRLMALEKDNSQRQASVEAVNNSTVLHRFNTSSGRYVMSRPMMRNSAIAGGLCGVLGGYLAEINTQLEYNTIANALDTFNGTNYNEAVETVLIGLNDEVAEGNWFFRAHIKTGTVTSYTNWNGSQAPARDRGKNCVVLASQIHWAMDNVPCYDNAPNVHFLCEIGK